LTNVNHFLTAKVVLGRLRGAKAPLSFSSPLSFEGEGDIGGEVETKRDCFASLAMTRRVERKGDGVDKIVR